MHSFFYHIYRLLTHLTKCNFFNEICIFLTEVVQFSSRDTLCKYMKVIFFLSVLEPKHWKNVSIHLDFLNKDTFVRGWLYFDLVKSLFPQYCFCLFNKHLHNNYLICDMGGCFTVNTTSIVEKSCSSVLISHSCRSSIFKRREVRLRVQQSFKNSIKPTYRPSSELLVAIDNAYARR